MVESIGIRARGGSMEQAQAAFNDATKPKSADALPPGVTEDDVQFTMKKYNVTREEVLRRLSGGNAP
jgi:NACalpha-BTF3-like transcription factor